MAPRNGGNSARALQDSVDRLAEAFDRMASRLEAVEAGGGGYAATDGDKVTRHIRRYMPFYALATVWALMLLILPTRQDNDSGTSNQASALTPGGAETFQDDGTSPIAGLDGDTSAAGGTGSRTGARAGARSADAASVGSQPVPAAVRGIDALSWDKTGKTRGGFDCKKGVRQLP